MPSTPFHGRIGALMGLVTFAFEATMLQCVVFPDASYRRLAVRLSARLAPLVRYTPRFE